MIRRFFKFVEIMTKITSVYAFLLAAGYLLYRGYDLKPLQSCVFFLSMFIFDLATTAINNYIDSKTNGQELQFKRSTARAIIFVLLGISAALGVYLAAITDLVILFVGALCFLCGIFYTFGPLPISRQPLGELFSGFFYGVLIPFIMLYINMEKGAFVAYAMDFSRFTIYFDIKVIPFVALGFLCAAPFCTTANIMLANNICDVEKDAAVKRHTLPYYLGKKSLYLFAALYYLIYIVVAAAVAFKIFPMICLLFLPTIVLVQRNISAFFKKQSKSETFVLSVKNYIIIMTALCLLMFAGALLK